MLMLYHNDMSTCSQKVRLALAEKGQDWESRHLKLRQGDQQKPDYLKLNPNGVVPTLEHDGTVIIESTIINEYVADAFDGTSLKPADPVAAARMRKWTQKLDTGMHANTGVVSGSIAFRYQHLEKSPEELAAYIERIPDPARRERSRANIELGVEAPAFAPAIRAFDTLLADMEEALGDGPWLAGDTYSLADVAYTPYATRLDHLQLHGMWDKRPRVADWYERLKARPSYDTAVTAWLNDTYLPLMREKGQEVWPRVKEIIAS